MNRAERQDTSAQAKANDEPAQGLLRGARSVLIVALLWTVSGQGYNAAVDALGLDSGYNDAALVFIVYYAGPKSTGILFQQTLAAALILTVARAGFNIAAIAVGMAAAFGGFHLLLAFDGFLPIYITRFTLAATAFGALLPHLYLRAKNGFRWAYGLYRSFYAVDAALTHLILSVPPWAQS